MERKIEIKGKERRWMEDQVRKKMEEKLNITEELFCVRKKKKSVDG